MALKATGPQQRTRGRPRSPSILRTDAGHVLDLRPADDRTAPRLIEGHGRFIRRVETLLRYLFDGRPLYEPGLVEFHDGDGAPLDLHHSARKLHQRRSATSWRRRAPSTSRASSPRKRWRRCRLSSTTPWRPPSGRTARRGGRRRRGGSGPPRILGFNQKSEALQSAPALGGFTALGTFTDDRYVQRDPEVGDSAEGLMKKVGVVEGISDVSWHKDCAIGGTQPVLLRPHRRDLGHRRGPENGELGVVAGSHRANVDPLGIGHLDLPRVPLPRAPVT